MAEALAELVHAHEEEEDDDHCCCHHHHDEDDEDEHEHHCHHHHHDEDDDEEHEHHHHHHHDDDEDEHEHHHHYDEHGNCNCGHHHDEDGHEHHHHHHADEVFTSWGVETPRKYTMEEIRGALNVFDEGKLGSVLRAKGIVAGQDGLWIHFDYVPGEVNVRTGSAAVTGKLCVIGSNLDEAAITRLFGV